MFLKREVRRKDGKEHVYYCVAETTRVGRERVVQRRLLNLGELNTTQIDRWQRSIEVIEEDGRACQRRLFSDREGRAPQQEEDVCEVVLSSLCVRRPRTLGDCWLGCRLWEELGLDTFWSQALGDRRGAVEWSKVMELLAVNRLCAPGSELSIHERWFSRTAMDFLLGCDEAVAGKDRLYRALDKALEHRDALMSHLQERWSDLFGAECQILLYDLTSTYFEGEAAGVESAARGYSRDHRPDTLQVVLALVVTPEGFPVAYEVFDGDTADVTTLEEIVDKIETKYGMRGRVWVFDRGVVSEDNLQDLRQRGAYYLVGTPRRKLADFERELLEGDWQEIAGKPGVRVQLLKEGAETFVLARSLQRAKKESAILRSQLTRLHRSLRALSRIVARGGLKDSGKIERRLGRLEERYPQGWSMLSAIEHRHGRLLWSWNKARLQGAKLRQGAYLLRTNLDPMDPDALWRQYVQLTEVEAAFRALKSELAIRPIWHRIQRRVQAHILVAFLGYCLWVCLKQKLKAVAESITPARALESLRSILMVEVWFNLREGGQLCLPRITEAEKEQTLLLHHLAWQLPAQPPPRIYRHQVPKQCSANQATSRKFLP
jgi:transposase